MMRNKSSLVKRLLVFFLGIMLYQSGVLAQNEKFKALFIYNFTRYIEWPSKSTNGFKIVIIGNAELVAEMNGIASKMKVGQNAIVVSSVNAASEVSDCQILYISKNHMVELSKFLSRARAGNMLILTESDNACSQGACLNFINKNGNLNFEISKTNLDASGLKVNASLLALGKVVN